MSDDLYLSTHTVRMFGRYVVFWRVESANNEMQGQRKFWTRRGADAAVRRFVENWRDTP